MSGLTIHIPIDTCVYKPIYMYTQTYLHKRIYAYTFSAPYAYENMCKDEYEGIYI